MYIWGLQTIVLSILTFYWLGDEVNVKSSVRKIGFFVAFCGGMSMVPISIRYIIQIWVTVALQVVIDRIIGILTWITDNWYVYLLVLWIGAFVWMYWYWLGRYDWDFIWRSIKGTDRTLNLIVTISLINGCLLVPNYGMGLIRTVLILILVLVGIVYVVFVGAYITSVIEREYNQWVWDVWDHRKTSSPDKSKIMFLRDKFFVILSNFLWCLFVPVLLPFLIYRKYNKEEEFEYIMEDHN